MFTILSIALVLGSAPASPDLEARLGEATVTLHRGGCAAAIAGDRQHLLTAAHCVSHQTAEIPVQFANGAEALATPETIMRDRDVAVLRLDRDAPYEPLEVAVGLPVPGTTIFFGGRNDDPSATLQEAVVRKLAPCPSLPGVPAALHTSIRGKPGDSGSPLVDDELRVVGLVHGGAMCSIATPAHPAAVVLTKLGGEGPQCMSPPPGERERDRELGVGGSGPAAPEH